MVSTGSVYQLMHDILGLLYHRQPKQGIPSLGSPLTIYTQSEATGISNTDTYIPVILQSSEAIIYDRETGKYELENQTQNGVPGDGPSSSPVISADGRYVAFVSASTNLVEGDNNNYSDVFVRDRETGKIELVSTSSTGKTGKGDSGLYFFIKGILQLEYLG